MDINTLLFVIASTSVMLAIVMGVIGYRGKHASLSLWAIGIILNASAFLALLLRPQIGEMPSVLIGNTGIAGSFVLLTAGWAQFQKQHASPWLIWVPIPLTIIVNLILSDDLPGRILANGVIVWSQALFLLLLILRGRRSTPGVGLYIFAAGLLLPMMSLPLRMLDVIVNPGVVVALTSISLVQTISFLVALYTTVLFVIGVIVAVRERAEAELRLSEENFRTYVEDANDVIYTLNLEGYFQYLSPNLYEVLGYRPEELCGQHFSNFIHPDDMGRCAAFLEQILVTRKKQSELEYRVRHKNGDWHWHMTNASPLFDNKDRLIGMLGIGRDIRDRKAAEAQISHLAHYDALTDLPNRTLLFDRLQQALLEADRNHRQVGLMFIDLDQFKPINDTHGHAIGDLVLQEVARRLLANARASDSIGRIGGDEFLVLLPQLETPQSAQVVANKILTALRAPFFAGDLRLSLSCSIGIALYPRHGEDITTLVAHADQAMYRAKQDGRDKAELAH